MPDAYRTRTNQRFTSRIVWLGGLGSYAAQRGHKEANRRVAWTGDRGRSDGRPIGEWGPQPSCLRLKPDIRPFEPAALPQETVTWITGRG
jgi:hypothetical protein